MIGFYTPEFPEIGYLKKLGAAQGMDENIRKGLLDGHMDEGEKTLISKVFGSRNPILMYQNCDIGWLIVTNKRILFWSDKSKKPHIAVNFEDISHCSSRWAIMQNRSVRITVGDKNLKFGTYKNAARLIEKLCQDSELK